MLPISYYYKIRQSTCQGGIRLMASAFSALKSILQSANEVRVTRKPMSISVKLSVFDRSDDVSVVSL